MTIKFIYKFIPVLVIYTNRLMTETTSGYWVGFFIFQYISIRPKYRNDEGILRHELEHARQNIKCLGFLLLLWLFVRRVRQWAEVQAYRVQLRYPPASGDWGRYLEYYVRFLTAPKYRLNLTIKEAKILLDWR